jgi:hypothetical protein
MRQFAFSVVRQASGEFVQRWEPPDRFDPALDIHLGQQFTTADGRYAVVAYQLYDERDAHADVDGVIEVARIDDQ